MIIIDMNTGEEEVIQERAEREAEQEEDWNWMQYETQLQLEVVK